MIWSWSCAKVALETERVDHGADGFTLPLDMGNFKGVIMAILGYYHPHERDLLSEHLALVEEADHDADVRGDRD